MATVYGKSYTDSKTQSRMMKFLRASTRLTSKVTPRTQLNKQPGVKNDYSGDKKLQRVNHGPASHSPYDERISDKPMSIRQRHESQKTNYKPGSKSHSRPRNHSKVNRKFK